MARTLRAAPSSECSRQRVQASKLAHPLAADPQRVSPDETKRKGE